MLNKVALFIASGFYTGFSPVAPGTAGSIVFFVLINFAVQLGLIFNYEILIGLALLVTVIGFWASTLVLKNHTASKDPQFIVVDEWAGYAVALLAIDLSIDNFLWTSAVALLLFRLFDIIKPWPIKKLESLPAAWGVMLDDLLAGLFALLALKILSIIIVVQNFSSLL